ncbi:DUF2271 domain-containing protein [Aliidiomarina shirensis]|uniref:DUF2271 domain-containing protein n=1 Tax=Aliidiomarina shirensis TaxID=1048642 RepID=A0A432WSU7_9GAMM|nr:DUF2271 domain-containing protein [Aliidiomarina shirensis]RUO36817.1 DUF2271 domain-containing protein [Aliidiomarina shirensis]
MRNKFLPLVLMSTITIGSFLFNTARAEEPVSLTIDIEIPQIQVAEYHRPYVAMWLANERQQAVADLGVWYDIALANQEGEKWLKDIRQWWRRSGRTLSFPVDGVSGATRAPGTHQVTFHDIAADGTKFSELPAGKYFLHIEAAREVGGREMLSFPIQLPLQETLVVEQTGETELGLVSATFTRM